MKHFLVLLVFALFSSSCHSYAKKRARDFADIVSITASTTAGASVIVGPVGLGLETQVGNSSTGLRGGYFADFDHEWRDAPILLCLVDVPDSFPAPNDQLVAQDPETQCYLELRNKAYRRGHDLPAYRYGSLGFSVGFLIGIRTEVNWLETLDFLAGIFGFDPLRDDNWTEDSKMFNNPASKCKSLKPH